MKSEIGFEPGDFDPSRALKQDVNRILAAAVLLILTAGSCAGFVYFLDKIGK